MSKDFGGIKGGYFSPKKMFLGVIYQFHEVFWSLYGKICARLHVLFFIVWGRG